MRYPAAMLAMMVCSASMLHAQLGFSAASTSRLPVLSTNALRATDDSAKAARSDVELTTAIVTLTSPGEVVVVRVPVPAALLAAARARRLPVDYRLVSLMGVRPLGASAGRLNSTRDSSVLVTFGVSKAAPAGRTNAAIMEFAAPGSAGLGVPLEFDVPVVRDVQLSMIDRYLGGVRGGWTTVRFRVRNGGNAAEAVSLRIETPTGWRTQLLNFQTATMLAAGSTVDASVRVWVPVEASAGVSMIRLAFGGASGILAASEVQIDVRDATGDRSHGPLMTASFATAGAPGTATTYGYGLQFSGNITDSVRVHGRYSQSVGGISGNSMGLARTGLMTAPPTLGIESSQLSLDLGATGGELSDIGGMFVNGFGAKAATASANWKATAFAIRPLGLEQANLLRTGDGTYAGGSLSRSHSRVTTTVHAAHLEERLVDRRLDVVGLRTMLTNNGNGMFAAEVAYRDVADGPTMGAAASFRRQTATSHFDAKVVHSPGGTRGFARAENEAVVSVSHAFTGSLSLNGGGWLQRDNNSLFGRTGSNGWYLMPMLRLRTIGGSIGLEARGNDFHTQSAMGRYENVDHAVGGMIDASRGSWRVSARSALGSVSRVMGTENAVSKSDGLRLDHRASLGKSSTNGEISLIWMSQEFAGRDQLMPNQQSMTMRADRVHVPIAYVPLTLNVEAQYMQSGSGMPSLWLGRVGTTISLPYSTAVTIGVERNPFVLSYGSNRRAPLLYTMRFDRSTHLPRAVSPKRQVVFTDTDGDDVRDRGEPGVPGVVLRCGSATLVSDANGRFGCDDVHGAEIDVRTLPDGLIAPSSGMSARSRDIALRIVHPIRVQLMLSEVDSFRVTQAELEKAVILARDSAGTLWTARSTGAGAFVFDAMPVGRYTIAFEQGDVEEPLRIDEELPVIAIGEQLQAKPIVIVVHPRSVRVRKLGNTAIPGLVPASPIVESSLKPGKPMSQTNSQRVPRS